jgi:hypothetical protein
MTDDQNRSIVSTRDLGNGKKQVTFSLDNSRLDDYIKQMANDENVHMVDGGPQQIAKGSVMSRYLDTSPWNGYTSNQTPYTQALKTPFDPHMKIQLATEIYFKEPIVGTAVDLMVDFSSSGFTNECDDTEIKSLYDKWCEEMHINQLLENIFLDFYRCGNVTIYRSDKSAKVVKKSKGKTGVDTSQYTFPSGYSVLNPMNVYVYGPLLFDQEIMQLQISSLFMGVMSDNSNLYADVLKKLPKELSDAIKNGSALITLDPDRCTRITRKKQPYERYASPFLERVFEPVLYKQKLRQMDMSTIEGLVNQLVTVTVGNDDYPATEDDLKSIAELFQTPSKAYTVFWNHTLEVKFHKPEGLDTLTQDKYKQVNEDIIAGLGISRVLLDGQGSNFSTAWVSILSMIERLENAREKVGFWLENEYKKIAEENGFKTYPKVRFNKMNLREDTYIQDVLLAMYDRGLIDAEDVLTETGRDYESIVDMKKRNDKNADAFLPPEQPFQGGNTAPNAGRPSGTGGKYSKRKTSPSQNDGKAPKAKTSKATATTALYDTVQEDYEQEIQDYYDIAQSEIKNVIAENKDKDSDTLKVIVLATLMSLFKTMSKVGDKNIDNIFNQTVTEFYSNTSNERLQQARSELRSWNSSYVMKLANDIREDINAGLLNGNIDVALSNAFDSNRYRVKLIAESGVIESIRQASIQGNYLAGNSTAVWITAMDDRVCNTCKGLHGQQFNIDDVPPRPHSSCRCSLEFN